MSGCGAIGDGDILRSEKWFTAGLRSVVLGPRVGIVRIQRIAQIMASDSLLSELIVNCGGSSCVVIFVGH